MNKSDLSLERNELFVAEAATSWTFVLSRAVLSTSPVIVSFNDRYGSNCPVEHFVSAVNSKLITVVSACGLPLAGTVSIRYTQRVQVRSHPSFGIPRDRVTAHA